MEILRYCYRNRDRPFLSYLRSYPNQPPGYSLRDSSYGMPSVTRSSGKYSQLPGGITGIVKGHHRGHLTDHLGFLPLEKTVHYYLCGLDAMIDDVSQWLKKNHISPHNIHREIFFHSG